MSTPWAMPEDLKPYETFFRDLAGQSVEARMNDFGSSAAKRLAWAGEHPENPEARLLLAILCNAQVGLVVALKGAGMLKTPAAAEELTP